jgi:hypothetical protein
LERELAQYISALDEAAGACTRAEDRARYQAHLAAAARMFAALSPPADQSQFLSLVQSEVETYGRGFLSGTAGEQAESAFQTFAAAARSVAT